VDSVIRLHKVVTIPKSLIKRKLGTVNKTIVLEIRNKISQLFDNE
jgi:mRNA-degrading endonuclease toxin of MazEF toxin-antitoxin module